MNVKRDYAGGMGVADPSLRSTHGHDPGYITLPYMSLLYTAAVVEEAGHEVVFVDAQADGLGIPEVVARVREAGAEVLVSVLNLPSLYGDIEVLKGIKQAISGIRTVALGTVCIPLFDEIAASGAADAVIQGDPEPGILDVLEVFSGKSAIPDGAACVSKPGDSGTLTRSAPAEEGKGSARVKTLERQHGVLTNRTPFRITDLDALPRLPYHLVPIEKYWYHGFGEGVRYAAVFASRGCSFKCYYCPYPVGFGDRIVHRDPIKVVDEIEDLHRQHGVKGILFRDQVFTMDWDKTHRLCDEIIRRNLGLQWVVETRLDRVNADLLRKMKQAGCVRVHYGLESGDPRLFSRVGKDGAEDRMEALVQNFIATEQAGIHPHMFILIGLVGETRNTIERTISVIQRIKPLTLQVAVVTPYPGTPLYDEVREKGLLLTQDWAQYTGFRAVARTEALSAEDLEKARRRILSAHRSAIPWKRRRYLARLAGRYLRDGSLWRRVMRRVSG